MTEPLLRRVFREKRAIILVLVALATANLVFFAAVVFPLQRRVASADQRAAAAATELAAAEREHASATETVTGKERAEQELRRFYDEILPSDQSAARRITYLRLAELARDSDLLFDHRTFKVEEQRGSALRRLDIVMLLSGPYGSVREFIHALERAKEFVVVAGVELMQRDDQSPALDLTVRLATYYRTAGDGR